jgi:hypothetical protein
MNWKQRHIKRGSQHKDAADEKKHTAKGKELVLVCISECQWVIVLKLEGFAHPPVCDTDCDVGEEVNSRGYGAEPGEDDSSRIRAVNVSKDC